MIELLEKLLDKIQYEDDVESALLLIIQSLTESNQVSSQELNSVTDSVIEALNDYRLGMGTVKPVGTIH